MYIAINMLYDFFFLINIHLTLFLILSFPYFFCSLPRLKMIFYHIEHSFFVLLRIFLIL